MAKLENMRIGFTPFNLSIEIGDDTTEPCIRGMDVQLRADDVEFPKGASAKAVATDVLEHICSKLYGFGIVLHFTTEAHEGEHYLKSISIARLYGRDLSNGSGKRAFEANSLTDDSNCWNWRVCFADVKIKDRTGRGLGALDEISLTDIRTIVFDFGVAPPTA